MEETQKVTVVRTFGNFKFTWIGTITAAVAGALLEAGVAQNLQRVPASGAEKKLANWPDGKRPTGFKRTDIPYSEANADVLKGFLESFNVDVSQDDAKEELVKITADSVVIEQYTPNSGGEPKYSKVKEFITKYLAAKPDRTIEGFCATRELTVPNPASGWADDNVFLASADVWLKAKLAAMAEAE